MQLTYESTKTQIWFLKLATNYSLLIPGKENSNNMLRDRLQNLDAQIHFCTHMHLTNAEHFTLKCYRVFPHGNPYTNPHTSFCTACRREQGDFVNISTKEEVYFFAVSHWHYFKKKCRAQIIQLIFMVPKNVVKCLLFTGNVKPFKSLCTVGVSRCKRKGKSWHEKWMIKIFKVKMGRKRCRGAMW